MQMICYLPLFNITNSNASFINFKYEYIQVT